MSYFYRVLFDEVQELRKKTDKNGNLIENDELRQIIDFSNIDQMNITDRMLKLSIYKEEFAKLEIAVNQNETYNVEEELDIQDNSTKEDYSELFE